MARGERGNMGLEVDTRPFTNCRNTFLIHQANCLALRIEECQAAFGLLYEFNQFVSFRISTRCMSLGTKWRSKRLLVAEQMLLPSPSTRRYVCQMESRNDYICAVKNTSPRHVFPWSCASSVDFISVPPVIAAPRSRGFGTDTEATSAVYWNHDSNSDTDVMILHCHRALSLSHAVE